MKCVAVIAASTAIVVAGGAGTMEFKLVFVGV